jgi:hypothetical protein
VLLFEDAHALCGKCCSLGAQAATAASRLRDERHLGHAGRELAQRHECSIIAHLDEVLRVFVHAVMVPELRVGIMTLLDIGDVCPALGHTFSVSFQTNRSANFLKQSHFARDRVFITHHSIQRTANSLLKLNLTPGKQHGRRGSHPDEERDRSGGKMLSLQPTAATEAHNLIIIQ